MEIYVKFYSGIARKIGKEGFVIELPSGSNAGELLELLYDQYPVLAVFKDFLVVAVNKKEAVLERELFAGDEVGLMPPIAGG